MGYRVKDLIGDGAQRIHHQRADGDVGHETTVHGVDVDPLRTSFVHSHDLRCVGAAGQGRYRCAGEGKERGRGG